MQKRPHEAQLPKLNVVGSIPITRFDFRYALSKIAPRSGGTNDADEQRTHPRG